MRFGLFTLPDDVARKIFQYLGPLELARLARVSGETKRIAEENIFWNEFYKSEFSSVVSITKQEAKNIALLAQYHISYKDIINKIHRLNLRKQDATSAWQIVLLSENMEAVIQLFNDAQNLEKILQVQDYLRYNYLSPLHYAALLGNQEMLMYFIAKMLSINLPARDGLLPLHCAALIGHVEMMKFLVAQNADFMSADEYGQSITHFSARSGRVAALRYSLEDLKLPAETLTLNGDSLLHCAAMSGKEESVVHLLQHVPALDLTLRNTANLTARDVAKGSVKILLEKKMAELPKSKIPDMPSKPPKSNGCTIS